MSMHLRNYRNHVRAHFQVHVWICILRQELTAITPKPLPQGILTLQSVDEGLLTWWPWRLGAAWHTWARWPPVGAWHLCRWESPPECCTPPQNCRSGWTRTQSSPGSPSCTSSEASQTWIARQRRGWPRLKREEKNTNNQQGWTPYLDWGKSCNN